MAVERGGPADPLQDAPGVEEPGSGSASAGRATTSATGLGGRPRRDGGPARLLDMIDDRSASALIRWLAERDPSWRAGIPTAALDPYRGYAAALRTSLPH